MKRPSVCLLTSELSGLNVRVIEALEKSDDIEIKRIIYAKKNGPFKLALIKRKIKKIFRIGLIGAVLGFWTRHWYTIRSNCLEDICDKLNLPLTKVKFLNSSFTRGLLALDKPTFILSLGNGYIKPDILDLADLAALNVHLESLPDYPGARSVIWRLYNNETKTGYAVHTMSSKIDKGYVHSNFETDIEFKSSLSETILCSLEDVMKTLEKNISHIILSIVDTSQNDCLEEIDKNSSRSSYTTPSFFQFLQIWLNFRRLRNEFK